MNLFRKAGSWLDHHCWFALAWRLKRFESPEHFSHLASGFHSLFWWKSMGYGWGYAFLMARICWSYLPGCSFLRRSCLPAFPINAPLPCPPT